MFITSAFIVRIIEALGNAAFLTASFAIIAKEFPNNISTTFVSNNKKMQMTGTIQFRYKFQ